MPRTEQEKVGMLPIRINLGEKVFEVKALRIREAQAWRQKFNEVMGPISLMFSQPVSRETNNLQGGLAKALLEFPEHIQEMVFAYAPSLEEHKEYILDNATEEQMAAAFGRIMEVGYPFLSQLGTVTSAIRASLSQ
jgi:hypothetical protein